MNESDIQGGAGGCPWSGGWEAYLVIPATQDSRMYYGIHLTLLDLSFTVELAWACGPCTPAAAARMQHSLNNNAICTHALFKSVITVLFVKAA